MTLKTVCSCWSGETYSISNVHEPSGVRADVTLERPSTTDGQTDVDRGSDEQETSRREQCHNTDPALDMAAARWTDTVASTSTDHQPHDSRVDEQGDATMTDGQTNVD